MRPHHVRYGHDPQPARPNRTASWDRQESRPARAARRHGNEGPERQRRPVSGHGPRLHPTRPRRSSSARQQRAAFGPSCPNFRAVGGENRTRAVGGASRRRGPFDLSALRRPMFSIRRRSQTETGLQTSLLCDALLFSEGPLQLKCSFFRPCAGCEVFGTAGPAAGRTSRGALCPPHPCPTLCRAPPGRRRRRRRPFWRPFLPFFSWRVGRAVRAGLCRAWTQPVRSHGVPVQSTGGGRDREGKRSRHGAADRPRRRGIVSARRAGACDDACKPVSVCDRIEDIGPRGARGASPAPALPLRPACGRLERSGPGELFHVRGVPLMADRRGAGHCQAGTVGTFILRVGGTAQAMAAPMDCRACEQGSVPLGHLGDAEKGGEGDAARVVRFGGVGDHHAHLLL